MNSNKLELHFESRLNKEKKLVVDITGGDNKGSVVYYKTLFEDKEYLAWKTRKQQQQEVIVIEEEEEEKNSPSLHGELKRIEEIKLRFKKQEEDLNKSINTYNNYINSDNYHYMNVYDGVRMEITSNKRIRQQ